jgi:methylmalonyl-CoA/ethylmalonyl-CoA epimerase
MADNKSSGSIKICGINHIGLAPKDPEKARWFFKEVLELPYLGDELVVEQKTNTVMFESSDPDGQATRGRLEILENQPGQEGPIKGFLEKRGGGIHHIALTVEDLESALTKLKSLGVQLIDDTPRSGAHKTKIAFIHPKSTGGLLVELVQR